MSNKLIYETNSAKVFIKYGIENKKTVTIEFTAKDKNSLEFETSYPEQLIIKIARIKTPEWLKNEIDRAESDIYVKPVTENSILSYVNKNEFKNKTILDFGSGSGSSSILLSKLFPESKIIGIEMVDDFVSIANDRIKFLGINNINFIKSESPKALPENLPEVDYVVMCGVYEHLLPDERTGIFLEVWKKMKKGGILFIFETPYRLYPIEFHSTLGLPIINYLPDFLTELFSKTFSRAPLKHHTWEELLRNGIRGGRPGKILKELDSTGDKAILLKPNGSIAKDYIDVWYNIYKLRDRQKLTKLMYYFGKLIYKTTGLPMTHYIYLAFQKK